MVPREGEGADVGVRLETSADMVLEARTIERLLTIASEGTSADRLPPMSAVDFILIRGGTATGLVEVKTRKESLERIKSYGGLMLKHKKLTELQTLSSLMNIPTFVVFAFENAEGPLLVCDPRQITDAQPVAPPTRRNYRGLACDEDPVIFLDWEKDLRRVM
jgi:hypothetical protein